MRNMVVAAISLFVGVPALLVVGYLFVPGIAGSIGYSVSNTFLVNAYFTLLGLVASSAVIAPLSAYLVQRQTNREWRSARLNAREYLGTSLQGLLDHFKTFILLAGQDDRNAPMFIDLTIRELAEFFEVYDDEQSVFSGDMHSAASNVRKMLVPLKRSLEVTHYLAQPRRSTRIYLSRYALDTLRALFDKPRLGRAEAPSRGARPVLQCERACCDRERSLLLQE